MLAAAAFEIDNLLNIGFAAGVATVLLKWVLSRFDKSEVERSKSLERSLTLLSQSVDGNTKAVEVFRLFEATERSTHEDLMAAQREIRDSQEATGKTMQSLAEVQKQQLRILEQLAEGRK